MARTVRRLGVTSSPVMPSPRVAPRTKRAPLVAEADRQPVDLQLADVRHRRDRPGRAPEAAAHAGVELAQLVVAEGVAERQHRRRRGGPMGSRPRPARRRAGSASPRVTSSGCAASSSLSSLKRQVVLAVADGRRVEHVVAVVRVVRGSRAARRRGRRSVAVIGSRSSAHSARPRPRTPNQARRWSVCSA